MRLARGVGLGIGTLAAGVALGLVWPAVAAFAHALPVRSVPAAGADLRVAPRRVVVTFSERPDPKLSSLELLDSTGRALRTSPTHPVPGDPLELSITAEVHLSAGVYTVVWKTVSAVDGHYATGSFSFGLRAAASAIKAPREQVNESLSTLAVLARWLMDAALLVLLGVAVFRLVALSATPGSLRGLLVAAFVVGLIGTCAITLAACRAASVPLSSIFSNSIGTQFLDRLIPAIATGQAVALFFAAHPRRRWPAGLVAATSSLWMAGDVLSSHADASSSFVFVEDLVQWAHFASAGCWAGGLVALALCLPHAGASRRAAMASRFSATALISAMVLLGTGIERAIAEVGSWSRLVSNTFGNFTLAKIVLLLLLLLLGARNRLAHVKRAGRSPAGLLSSVSLEIILLGLAVYAAGFLQNLAPPTSTAATSVARRRIVTGSDYAKSVEVRLVVSPGSVGENTFTVSVDAYGTTNALKTASLQLSFDEPSRPDIGTSTLVLRRIGLGTFAGKGTNLSIGGRWQIEAFVGRGLNSLEVPLGLLVRAAP